MNEQLFKYCNEKKKTFKQNFRHAKYFSYTFVVVYNNLRRVPKSDVRSPDNEVRSTSVI